MTEKRITKKEAATILKCSVDTIERRIKAGLLTAIKEHGRIWLDEQQVRSYGADVTVYAVHNSIRAVARRLKVSKEHVQRLVREKQIKANRDGHIIRDSVDSYLARKAYDKKEAAEGKAWATEAIKNYNEGIKPDRPRRRRGHMGKFIKSVPVDTDTDDNYASNDDYPRDLPKVKPEEPVKMTLEEALELQRERSTAYQPPLDLNTQAGRRAAKEANRAAAARGQRRPYRLD